LKEKQALFDLMQEKNIQECHFGLEPFSFIWLKVVES